MPVVLPVDLIEREYFVLPLLPEYAGQSLFLCDLSAPPAAVHPPMAATATSPRAVVTRRMDILPPLHVRATPRRAAAATCPWSRPPGRRRAPRQSRTSRPS